MNTKFEQVLTIRKSCEGKWVIYVTFDDKLCDTLVTRCHSLLPLERLTPEQGHRLSPASALFWPCKTLQYVCMLQRLHSIIQTTCYLVLL